MARREWKFSCYSSGSGALDFTWSINGKCEGRLVTLEDCQKWLDETVEGKRYKERGWRLVKLSGQFVLVNKIKRVNANTLAVSCNDGKTESIKEFQYEINPNYTFLNYDAIKVMHTNDVETYQVKHLGIVQAMCHFLRYEVVLADTGE